MKKRLIRYVVGSPRYVAQIFVSCSLLAVGCNGAPVGAPAGAPVDPCAGLGIDDYPVVPSPAASYSKGDESTCVAVQDNEMFIYIALKGFTEDNIVPRLKAVLGHVMGAELVVKSISSGAEGAVNELKGTGPSGIVRARSVWKGNIARFYIVLGWPSNESPASDSTKEPMAVGARPWDALVLPEKGSLAYPGTPCHQPQPESDLCKKERVLTSSPCDKVPEEWLLGVDTCRAVVDLLAGTSCEGGPDCGASETCQSGICCLLGTLVCGSQCYSPDSCETCINGVVKHRGNLETLSKDCKYCVTEFGMLSGVHCKCYRLCDADECCPSGEAGICVDKDDDPKNCGACGNVCPASQKCEKGKCYGLPEAWIGTADSSSSVYIAHAEVTWKKQVANETGITYRAEGTLDVIVTGKCLTVTNSASIDSAQSILWVDYQKNPPTYQGYGLGTANVTEYCPQKIPLTWTPGILWMWTDSWTPLTNAVEMSDTSSDAGVSFTWFFTASF